MMKSLIAAVAVAVGFTNPPFPKQLQPLPDVQPTYYKPLTWKCEDCSPEEQYVLAQLQDKTRITDRNAWQRSWEISNKRAISFPTYVREVLEFLTLIVTVVVMDSFNGLPKIVIWD